MIFGKIKGGFYTFEDYSKRKSEYQIVEGRSARIALWNAQKEALHKNTRGVFQEPESKRWVAFEYANGDILVEDFDDKVLAWAWLLMYEYGYYQDDANQWIAFTTAGCAPVPKSFLNEEAALEYINKFKTL